MTPKTNLKFTEIRRFIGSANPKLTPKLGLLGWINLDLFGQHWAILGIFGLNEENKTETWLRGGT